MRLKPILANTVVHTPTKEEAKELLAILHENGYKWCAGTSLIEDSNWEIYKKWTCYYISSYVEYGKMHEYNKDKTTPLTLSKFKERYCEMTEPLTEKAEETSVIQQKPQPKFKVNDIVKVVGYQTDCIASMGTHVGEVGVIIRAVEDDENYFQITCDNGLYSWHKDWLEPYTEPETKEETMEAKELNLCELLKGHEGETFYSPIVGDCTLKAITNYIYVAVNDHPGYCFFLDGRREKSGAVVFFPSRALYEQYPLDPYTAWMKWKEEQKKLGLDIKIETYFEGKFGWEDCDDNVSCLHFRTPTDRDKCIEEIKAIIEKYSKK